MSRSVLVTGSSGFTGAPLVRALAQRGHAVFGLTRTPQVASDLEGDLDDPASISAVLKRSRPDVVVHLAGIAFPAHPSAAEIYAGNVLGALRLLEAVGAAAHRPDVVFLASSATVYAPGSGTPIVETAALAPSNLYGASKLAMEDAAMRLPGDLPIRVVRPFNYTGPGQDVRYLIPKIVRHFARDTGEIQLGRLDLERDISDVEDAVETYARLVERVGPGPPLNICSGRAVRLSDIVERMREISGRDMRVVTNPAFVRANEPERLIGSTAALEAAIGVVTHRPLEETLARMYACDVLALGG